MVNANLLKGKIIAAGYTQYALAKQMNMSKNTLTAKILGKSSFNSDEILTLCELLDITSDKEKVEIFLAQSSHFRDSTAC